MNSSQLLEIIRYFYTARSQLKTKKLSHAVTAALRAPDKREIREIDQEKGKEKDQCTYYNQEGHWKNECHSSNRKEKDDHQILQQVKIDGVRALYELIPGVQNDCESRGQAH